MLEQHRSLICAMSHRIQYGITVLEELEFCRELVGTLILRCHKFGCY
jgi:hypothetical protein